MIKKIIMKFKKRRCPDLKTIYITIIIIVVLISGMAIYFWQKSVMNILEEELCTETNLLPDEEKGCENSESDNIDWRNHIYKTYKDEEYGFEFIYPAYFGDMVGGQAKGETSEWIRFKVHNGALDGYKYINQSGGDNFIFDANSKAWKNIRLGEYSESEPEKYITANSLTAYYFYEIDVSRGERAFIESPLKDFIVEIMVLRNESIKNCIVDCEGIENKIPLSNKETILSILDSLKFKNDLKN